MPLLLGTVPSLCYHSTIVTAQATVNIMTHPACKHLLGYKYLLGLTTKFHNIPCIFLSMHIIYELQSQAVLILIVLAAAHIEVSQVSLIFSCSPKQNYCLHLFTPLLLSSVFLHTLYCTSFTQLKQFCFGQFLLHNPSLCCLSILSKRG